MKKINDCHVIVCGPAVGKTYLAKMDSRFIDLDGEKAIYKYGLNNATDIELEKAKLLIITQQNGPLIELMKV